ncbi:hypothetical protein ABK040_012228 [Willaertia magna]
MKQPNLLLNEIVLHILSYLTLSSSFFAEDSKVNKVETIKSINKIYLVNKQFNECAVLAFDEKIYKEMLMRDFLKLVNVDFTAIKSNNYNYKTIYANLNHYRIEKIRDRHIKYRQNKLQKVIEIAVNEKHKYRINISVFGKDGVGKSSFTLRFTLNDFVEEYDPTIEDIFRKLTEVDGEMNLLEVTDTSSYVEDQTPKLREMNIRSTNCFIIICDLTDKSTLQEVEERIKMFYKVKETNELPIIIVGNKLDLIMEDCNKRQITREMINEITERNCKLSKELKPIYFEASAKSELNVTEIFHEAVRFCHLTLMDWNEIVLKLLNGEPLFKEFNVPQKNKSKCYLM